LQILHKEAFLKPLTVGKPGTKFCLPTRVRVWVIW
jgi:hypothetical protein